MVIPAHLRCVQVKQQEKLGINKFGPNSLGTGKAGCNLHPSPTYHLFSFTLVRPFLVYQAILHPPERVRDGLA